MGDPPTVHTVAAPPATNGTEKRGRSTPVGIESALSLTEVPWGLEFQDPKPTGPTQLGSDPIQEVSTVADGFVVTMSRVVPVEASVAAAYTPDAGILADGTVGAVQESYRGLSRKGHRIRSRERARPYPDPEMRGRTRCSGRIDSEPRVDQRGGLYQFGPSERRAQRQLHQYGREHDRQEE